MAQKATTPQNESTLNPGASRRGPPVQKPLAAATDVGLFRGTQTLRQLLPAKIEADAVQPGPWAVPGVRIVDYPRYEWRRAHLDAPA